MDRVAVDSVDAEFARVVIECRNFGQVSGTGGVARVSVIIDGKLPTEIGGAAGMKDFRRIQAGVRPETRF